MKPFPLVVALAVTAMLAACAPVHGFADNPADQAAVQAGLQRYFLADVDAEYAKKTGADRQAFRDEVVINRLRAYDIAFQEFQRRLWSDANFVSAGGDLVVLALAGLGATTAHAATASALAVASAGVVGAQSSISKDLYFQRTMPALLAQMQANRDRIKVTILNGLARPDAQYPLYRANADLDALQAASSIPSAVGDITQQASAAETKAKAELSRVSYVAGVVPASAQERAVKLTNAVRSLAASTDPSDAAKLDRLAAELGASRGKNKLEERNNILKAIDPLTNSDAEMNKLSARLSEILEKEY
jgi:hypothetical protein